MKKRTAQKIITALLSSLASLFVGVFSIYLSTKLNFWFIYIGSFFLTEGIFIFISMFIKDEYKKMRFLGIFQVINVIAMMCYLLVMILWNDNGNMLFQYSYYVYGGALSLKFILYIVNSVSIRDEYDVSLHTYRNNDFVSLSILSVLLELIIFKNIYPVTSIEDTLYVYIVEAATNAIFTLFASFFALSTIVRSDTHEPVPAKTKIKYTIEWFNEHEISFFFGLIFSSYLATMAFYNIWQNFIFFFLGLYYVGMSFIRFVNYLWHRKIKKKCGNNVVRENRLSSFILLFDAFTFVGFAIIISIASIAIMLNKMNVSTNIYWFLFYIIPLAIFRFVSSIKMSKKHRQERNTYKLGLSYTSLIAAFFSILEIVAIACHTWPIWAKVIIIILAVGLVSIGVTVMCIIFFIQFIRSLIINRRSREYIN